ncbi:SEC-C metal-binding domain-containing protein [Methylotuvimicrobium sp. KM2]|uniref:SEC-C metal-binding domain-containing protein n=1 Tax=Methylotuvimicrobium sp. KM2 TaxID=3133976 RepID=UPI003101A8F1
MRIPSSVEILQHVIDDIEAELEEQKTLGQTVSRPKIGRNAACPCGSGKKLKNCCLS